MMQHFARLDRYVLLISVMVIIPFIIRTPTLPYRLILLTSFHGIVLIV
jgi:hypothetical protein